ncbi:ankyrin repeat domain-containing protein [bacterium]|nr:ankyrin repeat domain-containing protein [bacterium]MBU1956871.1 ankyrin repeat domain-containing protein [bacterium]
MDALMEAIENDNVVQTKKLCEVGEDLTRQIDMGIEYGLEDPDETPILFYAIRKHASIELIEVLLKYGCTLDQVDDDGLGVIDIAIKFKREDVVQFCIDKGVDLNATSRKSGITPIVLAACFNNISIAKLLLDNGAEINSHDTSGMSTKDYAKKLGQKKMLEFLHERGAKYNRYVQDAQREATQAGETVEPLEEKGDMNNRKTPTEDMGFDSI